MKKLLSLLFVLGLTLSACSGTSETQSALPAQTPTPSLSPTGMIITTVTQTSIPPTSLITPLPTIPTFTPTFDVSTIVTVTPAEKAECPKENFNKSSNFPIRTQTEYYIDNTNEILDFLNQGGNLQATYDRLLTAVSSDNSTIAIMDLTGDQEEDLAFVDFSVEPKLHIFLCVNGQYEKFTPDINLYGYSEAISFEVEDLNKNGLPDLILLTSCSRAPLCRFISIFEWNGKDFSNLVETQEIFEGFLQREIKDINNDGTLEFIIYHDVRGDYPYFLGFPWRVSTHIYMWNGKNFVLQSIQYAKPEYRFQALQDGDRFVLLRNYDSAMKFYDMTISNSSLLPYSRELSEHMEWLYSNPMSIATATVPPPDLTEYPRLAAYAYYRVMLLHLVQGQEAEAASAFHTLQETFGSDPYAAPYAEMASAFWESYQSTQKMYDGCAAAIQYAVEHPEILIPLGSDYHGWQSHIYVPADVCPFR